jgi:hypothetical protein
MESSEAKEPQVNVSDLHAVGESSARMLLKKPEENVKALIITEGPFGELRAGSSPNN